MKRLTFETMLNFVYGKYGWAYIRHDGENADVPLTEWARNQCLNHGCDEFSAQSAEEIDEDICDCMMEFPDCPVALAYCFASQAFRLRRRLKMYEDILFSEDGTELISLEQLRTMTSQMPNPPLTLEEIREMDGEPVCINCYSGGYDWQVVDYICAETIFFTDGTSRLLSSYGRGWQAYRRKPEEEIT